MGADSLGTERPSAPHSSSTNRMEQYEEWIAQRELEWMAFLGRNIEPSDPRTDREHYEQFPQDMVYFDNFTQFITGMNELRAIRQRMQDGTITSQTIDAEIDHWAARLGAAIVRNTAGAPQGE